MNEQFKATHVIVATSYENASTYGLLPGTPVVFDTGYNEWRNQYGYSVGNSYATVMPIENYKPIKPVSLFTEAQLRELEWLYGLVASNDALPAARVVAAEPVDAYQIITFSDDGKEIWAHSLREGTKVIIKYACGSGLIESKQIDLKELLQFYTESKR